MLKPFLQMGECPEAKTDGIPATPRDGAPVEIVGLLYSTLAWLSDLVDSPRDPNRCVRTCV